MLAECIYQNEGGGWGGTKTWRQGMDDGSVKRITKHYDILTEVVVTFGWVFEPCIVEVLKPS